jgi:hypothetical protein
VDQAAADTTLLELSEDWRDFHEVRSSAGHNENWTSVLAHDFGEDIVTAHIREPGVWTASMDGINAMDAPSRIAPSGTAAAGGHEFQHGRKLHF